jgi:uncharacterized cupredoxin-like copper-binding protein
MHLNKALAPAVLAALVSLAAPAGAHGPNAHGGGPNLSAVTTAFGQTGDPKKVTRTVRVDMADTMRFTPAALTVRQGDTVRFVIGNSGKVMHEMVIGTDKELAEHAELMKKHPGMEHEEPYMAHVAPGKRGEIVWQFTQPGDFKFACLLPGHFEAGMVGAIKVLPR